MQAVVWLFGVMLPFFPFGAVFVLLIGGRKGAGGEKEGLGDRSEGGGVRVGGRGGEASWQRPQ